MPVNLTRFSHLQVPFGLLALEPEGISSEPQRSANALDHFTRNYNTIALDVDEASDVLGVVGGKVPCKYLTPAHGPVEDQIRE